MWKDKADIVQGIAGMYWILSFISFFLFATIIISGESWLLLFLFMGIIPCSLSIVVIAIKEDSKWNLPAFIGFFFSLIFTLRILLALIGVYPFYPYDLPEYFPVLYVHICMPLVGTAFILQAFDATKHMWKDKADIVQGIAGIYILFSSAFLLGLLPQVVESTIYFLAFYQNFYLFLAMNIAIPIVLSLVILLMKEDDGWDLFGFVGILMSLSFGIWLVLVLANFYIYPDMSQATYNIIQAVIIGPVVGIGFLLEAFDIIKPLKFK